ncbi:MAG: AAA family ATPase [Actinomycetota bacterium]|nr:AAA family ATPase [Actinomycetota bacterium]
MIDRSDELREMYDVETDGPLAGMFTGTWLDRQEFPPLEYAVPGIIPEGFGLLVAPPKAGKSWLVCGIGLACAAGGYALGCIPVTERPVLYLALEDGHRRLQARSRRLICDVGASVIPAMMHFVTQARPGDVIPMITEFLRQCSDQDWRPLIILDTLGKARPPRPPGADLYSWDYAIGGQLKDTIDNAPGATLIVVHHTRKTEAPDFVDSVSGSQGIAGSADFVLVLSRKRHSDEAVLSVTGRDIPEAEYALTTEGGLWRLDGASLSDAAKTAETRREKRELGDDTLQILELVNSRAETRAADVEDELGIPQHKARTYLSRLAESGRIHKGGRGVYRGVACVASVAFNEDNATHATVATPLYREGEL